MGFASPCPPPPPLRLQLVGGVKVLAELNIKGTNAHGSLDWAIVFRHFSIVVIEVRQPAAGELT